MYLKTQARIIGAAMIFAGCSAATQAPLATDGRLELSAYDFDRDGIAHLDGEWVFFPNRFVTESEAAKAFSTAHRIQVPSVWRLPSAHNPRDPTATSPFGIGTYYLKVDLPPDLAALSLSIRNAGGAYRLYINGEQRLSMGHAAATRSQTRHAARPARILIRNPGPAISLRIEMANHTMRNAGLFQSLSLGDPRQIDRQAQLRAWYDIYLAGSFLLFGLAYFVLHAFWRTDPRGIYFGAFYLSLVAAILVSNERVIYVLWPEFDWLLGHRIKAASHFLCNFFYFTYLRCLFPQEFRRTHAWLAGAYSALLLCLVMIVFTAPPSAFAHAIDVWFITMVPAMIWWYERVIQAVRRKREGAIQALLSLIILSATGVFVGLTIYFGFNRLPVGQFGIGVFLISQTLLFVHRYVNMSKATAAFNRELNRKNQKLISLDRIKDEFLANTSHELRSPLQGIIGIADSLRSGVGGPVTPETSRQLGHIVRSARRLTKLVNDLLDFSKLRNREIQTTSLRRGAVDLRSVTATVLELSSAGLDGWLEIQNEVPADLPGVYADEDRLFQILHNLVDNAIKFTNRGVIRVGASVDVDGAAVLITVRDTGIGIAPENLARIFSPFEQVDGGVSRSRGGTGIGLSITKALIELQEGSIRVESKPGKGSCFLVRLPLAAPSTNGRTPDNRAPAAPSADTAAIQAEATPVTSEHENHDGPHDGEPTRILIVDDEPVISQVLHNFITLAGHEAVEVADGETALQLLRIDPDFDAVILDVMMPRMSGYEVAREIRRLRSPLDLPILMATARDRNEDLVAALNAGANDYLVKPIEREELLLRLGNLLQMSTAHKNENRFKRSLQEAIKSERKRLNANLHDHLGAQLVDLRFLSRQLLDARGDDPGLMRRLHDEIQKASAALREQMLFSEDLDLLSENFSEGINLILLRRYIGANRELNFVWAGREHLDSRLTDESSATLYAIIKEISTNDLKYGRGVPHWSFTVDHTGLRMVLASETSYSLSDHGSGRGTQNIVSRSAELGGRVSFALDNDHIRIELDIPLPEGPHSTAGANEFSSDARAFE